MTRWNKFWAAVERKLFGFNAQESMKQAWREREAIVADTDRKRRLAAVIEARTETGNQIRIAIKQKKARKSLYARQEALMNEQIRLEGMGS